MTFSQLAPGWPELALSSQSQTKVCVGSVVSGSDAVKQSRSAGWIALIDAWQGNIGNCARLTGRKLMWTYGLEMYAAGRSLVRGLLWLPDRRREGSSSHPSDHLHAPHLYLVFVRRCATTHVVNTTISTCGPLSGYSPLSVPTFSRFWMWKARQLPPVFRL